MPLSTLVIENFQSIKDRTELDLNKLVFLFGPNSAGKSIIEDALSLVFTHLNWSNHEGGYRGNWEFFRNISSGRDSTLSRHWRLEGNKYSEFLRVGLKGYFESDNESRYYLTENEMLEIPDFQWEWDLKWSGDEQGVDELGRPEIYEPYRLWTFFVDGQILVDINGINMRHPILARLREELDIAFYDASTTGSDLQYRDGILVNGEGLLLPVYEQNTIRTSLFEPSFGAGVVDPVTFEQPLNDVLGAIANEIDSRIDVTRSAAMEPMAISASRMIPEPKDLTFVFHDPGSPESCLLGNTVCLDLGNDEPIVMGERLGSAQGMNLRNWDMFRELASGYFCNLSEVYNQDPEFLFENQDWLQKVNYLLSNYLFIDNGYQIDGEHAFVLSATELNRVASKTNIDTDSEWVAAQVVVTLMLRDAQGHKLHFNEVGSGIGYALPILISLVSGNNILNQQPELHLHPALQSQLGDLYLHTAKKNRYIIVETHSEHLLLRVLRRIRQRTRGLLDENDYRFATASDVSIYYFEPQGNGETKVRPIRISPEGDFLDPWPGGFFEERYEDLFDE